MKLEVIQAKRVFPIQEFEPKRQMTDKMLGNMIMYYSCNIKKLTISFYSIFTIDAYHFIAILRSNLLELYITNCSGYGLDVISSSLTGLTSLTVLHSLTSTSTDLDSLSKLTNLEDLNLDYTFHKLIDAAVVNYSTLVNLTALSVLSCSHLTGVGLGSLVVNKNFLVKLEVGSNSIVSDGYHCLTSLTNLTKLNACASDLDDIGLNMICSSCLLIEYLDIKHTDRITSEGLNSFKCLINLKYLFLKVSDKRWPAKLSCNTSLTHLDSSDSPIEDDGFTYLHSVLRNLNFLFSSYD
jgi:Leucine-rich repeat (LRR) protein